MNPTLWEYHVLANPTPAQFTALGQQGWELVAVTAQASGFAAAEKAYFKRPKPAGAAGGAPGGK